MKMPRTRASKPPASKEASDVSSTTTASLPPPDSNPPKVFILPKHISPDARIRSLPDPAHSKPTRYLVCPNKGFFEFTKVAASPRAQPRSWLIIDEPLKTEAQQKNSNGYVIKHQDLFVATPLDPLFLLLPLMAPKESVASDKKSLFKVIDDYLDSAPNELSTLRALLRDEKIRKMCESRLRAVCDVVEAGDEVMFRFSQDKYIAEIQTKTQRLVAKGLPASLEDKFVSRALDIPISGREHTSVKVKESPVTSITWTSEIKEDAAGSVTRTISSSSESATAQEPSSNIPTHLLHLLRAKTALSFILRSYVQPFLRDAALASTSALDFTPLELHLSHITEIRNQAQALRTISNNIGRKRSADEDEDAAVDYEAIKRQKKEEDEKKRKMTSFGVKALAKVNTKGMKKMSSFFVKKEKT